MRYQSIKLGKTYGVVFLHLKKPLPENYEIPKYCHMGHNLSNPQRVITGMPQAYAFGQLFYRVYKKN